MKYILFCGHITLVSIIYVHFFNSTYFNPSSQQTKTDIQTYTHTHTHHPASEPTEARCLWFSETHSLSVNPFNITDTHTHTHTLAYPFVLSHCTSHGDKTKRKARVCAITQPWLTLPLPQLGSERGSLRSKQFQYKLEFSSFSLKTRKRKGEKKRGEKMEEIPEEMRVDLQHGKLTQT